MEARRESGKLQVLDLRDHGGRMIITNVQLGSISQEGICPCHTVAL